MLDPIFNAQSVAVIGASKVKTKRGYQAINTLIESGYEGKIYPVHPSEKSVLGFECYENITKIEGTVDIALITTPAFTIPGILDDCGKKGVKGAIIIAGGFAEMGGDGKALEEELIAAACRNSIRLIGPNTSGMMNLKSGLNLVGIKNAPAGNIALLAQSGNIALTLITEAQIKGKNGFSYYVGVGNEADIKFHEYLDFFTNDEDTKAILMYVEGMRDGRKFLQQAYKTTRTKPIVLLKSGRSATGKKSAGSHTGALAGMSEVAKTAFQRAGIIVSENPDELFPIAESLASLPMVRNNKIAILADGGGHATIASDILSDIGVGLPELESKTIRKLKEILPRAASVRNPVDVAGGTDSNPGVFADCAKIILKDHNVGGLLIVGLFGGYGIRFDESLTMIEEDAAHRMGKMVRSGKKPIIVHSLYSSTNSHPLELLRYYGIPVYDSLEISCKCFGALCQYGKYVKSYKAKSNFEINHGENAKKKAKQLFIDARKEGRTSLLEHEAKALFRIHGAPVTEDMLAKTADEAVNIAKKIKDRVVLKIVSPDILHKTDAGGVRLKLKTEKEIRDAFSDIISSAKRYNPEALIKGVLVSPMAHKGIEVIIGTKTDEQFGPVIMYGLGGVMVEIMKDISFRVLPISPTSAKQMIKETRSYPLLDGFRGEDPYDKKSLKKLLLICSEVIQAYPDEIEEIDLNPVIVNKTTVSIVDARVIMKKKGNAPENSCTPGKGLNS